ncbi:MAG: FAD-binding protein, partial [Flavobacteriales bacterium]|nr:FAD-binding protein [Flavobacteriales bacterium]
LGFKGQLGGLAFQRDVERTCWEAAGKSQRAPAQRLLDFLTGDSGRVSKDLPPCSYVPGVVSVNLRELLPDVISDALAAGLRTFGKRMPRFMDRDAILIAPESRTSSPVRIPRDRESLMHPDVAGLYPCGEGGGYAGGILSAALDGMRVADAVHATQKSHP